MSEDRAVTSDDISVLVDGEWVEESIADVPSEADTMAANAGRLEDPADPYEDEAQPAPLNTDEDRARVAEAALGPVVPLDTVADVLDATRSFVQRFVVFANRAQAVAVTLWVAHTWWKSSLDTSPYLAVLSAEKRSGKSRLFDVIQLLVAEPWRVTFPTAAVLFRKIDKDRPTLLLDEVDTIFSARANPSEDLRGIFNDGNRLGGSVPRLAAKGRTWEIEEFSTFCPKAFAGIGRALPDTVTDRAIVIRLRRKARNEPAEKFRYRRVEPESLPIREALEVISEYHELNPDPSVPAQLHDRAADGWEPLLSVADLAGGDWPNRARAAAVFLAADQTEDDDSLGVRLLADVQRVFETSDHVDRMSTVDLLAGLNDLEDAPWGELRGRPLSPHGLSKFLRPFDVRPRKIRFGASTAQGYRFEDFGDAFARYLPDETGTAEQANNDRPERVPDGSSPPVNRNTFEPATTGNVPVFRFEPGDGAEEPDSKPTTKGTP